MENVLVTIQCVTYNQEVYIRQCLEGLISQKTDFHFQILVHDDASTDGTAQIIRQYEQQYPQLIKGIYEEENLYSRGGFQAIMKVLSENSQGKYVAYCEGDDFWTDSYKLQKQVDVMEAHQAVLCTHQVRSVREDGEKTERLLPKISESFVKDTKEFIPFLFSYGNSSCFVFQACSFLMKRDLMEFPGGRPQFMELCDVGDVPVVLYLGANGTVAYLAEEMACYRLASKSSWSKSMRHDRKRVLRHEERMCSCFEEYKNYTEHRFDPWIDGNILKTRFNMLMQQGDYQKIMEEPYRSVWTSMPEEKKRIIWRHCRHPFLMKWYNRLLRKVYGW